MKNQKSVFEFGKEFQATEFFDVETQTSGVDIKVGTKHLGSIVGLSIPDIEDEDENEKFDNEVVIWLVDNDFKDEDGEDQELEPTLTLSTESYDEALNFLINKFGFYSLVVKAFYNFGKSDDAINYSIELGFDIED